MSKNLGKELRDNDMSQVSGGTMTSGKDGKVKFVGADGFTTSKIRGNMEDMYNLAIMTGQSTDYRGHDDNKSLKRQSTQQLGEEIVDTYEM